MSETTNDTTQLGNWDAAPGTRRDMDSKSAFPSARQMDLVAETNQEQPGARNHKLVPPTLSTRRLLRAAVGFTLLLSALLSVAGCSGGNSNTGEPVDSQDAAEAGSADAGGNDASTQPGQDAPSDTTLDTGRLDAQPEASGGDAGDAAPCSEGDNPCPGKLTCCDGKCVDVLHDLQHCGACNLACGAGQFCTGQLCADALLKSVCANPHATVSLDEFPADNQAGQQIGNSLLAPNCNSTVLSVRSLNQTDPTIQHQPTGEPITGAGDTYVAAGGGFGQRAVKYLDDHALSLVYVNEGTRQDMLIVRRDSSAVVADIPIADVTDHHDYIIYQTVVASGSGTLALVAYGMMAAGTTAAGWYWANTIAPNISDYDKSWYVIEWRDTDNDSAPSQGDTFSVMAKGP